MTTGNHGIALMHLAVRKNDAAMAETALLQIEVAFEMTQGAAEAYYQARFIQAHSILAGFTL